MTINCVDPTNVNLAYVVSEMERVIARWVDLANTKPKRKTTPAAVQEAYEQCLCDVTSIRNVCQLLRDSAENKRRAAAGNLATVRLEVSDLTENNNALKDQLSRLQKAYERRGEEVVRLEEERSTQTRDAHALERVVARLIRSAGE